MYHEMFDNIENCQTEAQVKQLLSQYGTENFKSFLQLAFSPHIIFETTLPYYKPAVEPEGLNWTLLENEIGKLYRFIKNHPAKPVGLTHTKQQQLLWGVLESLHKREAELLVKAIKKELNIKNLNVAVINDVFPGLIKV